MLCRGVLRLRDRESEREDRDRLEDRDREWLYEPLVERESLRLVDRELDLLR